MCVLPGHPEHVVPVESRRGYQAGPLEPVSTVSFKPPCGHWGLISSLLQEQCFHYLVISLALGAGVCVGVTQGYIP